MTQDRPDTDGRRTGESDKLSWVLLWLRQKVESIIIQTEGQSLVLLSVSFIALMGLAGLGVSVGNALMAKGQLQDAVDAGALAGAQTAAAGGTASNQSSLIQQDDPGASGTVSIDPSNLSYVDANGTKVVSGGFAALFGVPSFTLRARAVAQYSPGQAFNYAVFQGAQNSSLTFNGNVYVQSVGGPNGMGANVFSNGNIALNGNVTITGTAGAVGTISPTDKEGINEEPNQPVIQMPQWQLPALPNTTGWQTVTSLPSGASNSSPDALSGNYVVNGGTLDIDNDTIYGSVMAINGGSIKLDGTDTINGSLYTSGGGSISLNGSGTVNGNIEAAQNTTNSASTITLNGGYTVTGFIVDTGGNISLNGNDSSGSSPGLTIGAFAQNGVGGNIDLNGTVNLTGVLYAPSGTITFNGNDTLIGSAVANTDALNGNVNISYSTSVVDGIQFSQVNLIQ